MKIEINTQIQVSVTVTRTPHDTLRVRIYYHSGERYQHEIGMTPYTTFRDSDKKWRVVFSIVDLNQPAPAPNEDLGTPVGNITLVFDPEDEETKKMFDWPYMMFRSRDKEDDIFYYVNSKVLNADGENTRQRNF